MYGNNNLVPEKKKRGLLDIPIGDLNAPIHNAIVQNRHLGAKGGGYSPTQRSQAPGMNMPQQMQGPSYGTPDWHFATPNRFNTFWGRMNRDFEKQSPFFGQLFDLMLKPTVYPSMRKQLGLLDDNATFNRDSWRWEAAKDDE